MHTWTFWFVFLNFFYVKKHVKNAIVLGKKYPKEIFIKAYIKKKTSIKFYRNI